MHCGKEKDEICALDLPTMHHSEDYQYGLLNLHGKIFKSFVPLQNRQNAIYLGLASHMNNNISTLSPEKNTS